MTRSSEVWWMTILGCFLVVVFCKLFLSGWWIGRQQGELVGLGWWLGLVWYNMARRFTMLAFLLASLSLIWLLMGWGIDGWMRR